MSTPPRPSWRARLALALGALSVGTVQHAGCGGTDVVADPAAEACVDGEVRDCYPGAVATRGVGPCREGEQQCLGGRWSDCLGYVGPIDELCGNHVDDDCNGAADDGCDCTAEEPPQDCYGGPAITREVGECSDGVQRCVDGHWSAVCDGEVVPAAEICDGLDNDCTGITDEGCACEDGQILTCYAGPAGTAGVGDCRAGTQSCVSGHWSTECAGEVLPETELCNGLDDDCDGTADDGNPGGGASCSTGLQGPCASGTMQCSGGSVGCEADVQPSAEQCDGVDDNCNGVLDDGTFLPSNYESIEYVPAGWGNLPQGVLLTWDSQFAYWDVQQSAVTAVGSLADAWLGISGLGTQPPPSGVTSVLALDGDLLDGSDSIVVLSGSTVHFAVLGDTQNGWQQTTVSAWLSVPGLTNLASATVFYAGEIAPSIDVPILLGVDAAQTVWVLGTGQPLQMTVDEAFCPPGSTNCPQSAQALARIPATPTAFVLVQSQGVTYSSQFLYDTNGALYYEWTAMNVGSVSCMH